MKRRDALKALVAGAAVPAGLVAAPDPASTVTTEIEALLRRTEVIWNSQDTAALRDLWDRDDPEPFYLAGEQENPLAPGRFARPRAR